MQTYIHAYIHTYVHAYIHTYIHTYIRAYIHTYIHTYIHAHMFIHLLLSPPSLSIAFFFNQDFGVDEFGGLLWGLNVKPSRKGRVYG